MYAAVARHLQDRADLLMADRLDDLAGLYLLPQAIYLGDAPWVLTSATEVITALGRLRQLMQDRHVHTCTANVTALELPRRGRFRAWVRWDEVSADPWHSASSTGVYYFRVTPDGLMNEMLEFPQISLPEFRQVTRPQQRIA